MSGVQIAAPDAAQAKAQAYGLGFDLAGVMTLGPPDTTRDVTEAALRPRADRVNPDAAGRLALTETEWLARFGTSAMARAKRRGLARNAAVALGNRRDPPTIPSLDAAASDDPDPMVRAHAAWSLAQFE